MQDKKQTTANEHSTACLYGYALARLGLTDTPQMRVLFWDAQEALEWDEKTDRYVTPSAEGECSQCGHIQEPAHVKTNEVTPIVVPDDMPSTEANTKYGESYGVDWVYAGKKEAPAAVAVPERWCPDVCPITRRRFFGWIEHWKTGQEVPTYGGPFDSYTIPVKDEDGTFSCERFDHDAGEWMTEGMGWCCLGLMLTDDQAFVVQPDNPRYDEIRDFAEGRAALAATPAAAPQTQPVGIDDQTMELAESVGLIGPTSRTHDLHAAIQRFHDLIVVNASIKAAQDFAKELKKFTTAAPVVLPEPAGCLVYADGETHHWDANQECAELFVEREKKNGAPYAFTYENLYTEQQLRALLATATGLPAQAAKPSGLLTVDEYQAKYLHIHKMSDDERYGYESLYNEIVSGLQMPAAAPQAQAFQQRVQPWMMACFGPEISADSRERNHRFLEEALELVQSCGCTASEAHQLVDYVYGRPWGEPAQEVGGVMVTLAALCLANGLDMHACGETELARIWTKVEAIRAKQAAKPKHSPLPEHAPQAQAEARDAERYRYLRGEHEGEAESLCVFGPNDMRECLVPIGSLPGELNAFIDAAIAAAKGEQQ